MVEKKILEFLTYVNENAAELCKALEDVSPINEILAGDRNIAGARIDYIEKEKLKDVEEITLEFEDGMGLILHQGKKIELFKDNDMMDDEEYEEKKEKYKKILKESGFKLIQSPND